MIKSEPLNHANYRNIVFLTGAGISVASGLQTYRGPGGLWEQADIARIADAANLPESLPDLWRLYSGRRAVALAASPNAAHNAIAELQKRYAGTDTTVTPATQNVDGLHRRAGSENLLELHGSAFRSRCLDPNCPQEPFPDEASYDSVPPCPTCGGPLRPDVVLFSENLSQAVLWGAVTAAEKCDLFIAVGTSGVVWPAAAFVQFAAAAGARTINVNVEMSGNPHFDEEYLGPAEVILPQLFG